MTAATGPIGALARATIVPRAFFIRDQRIAASYRAGMLLGLGSAAATVGIFFFLSRTIDAAAPTLTEVSGSYFDFVLVGIAVQVFLAQAVGGFGGAVRDAQVTGTLELMLIGPSRLLTLLTSSVLWLMASAFLGAGAYLALGILLGVDLSRIDLPATVLGIALMIVGFVGMGFMAGGTVLVIKRGNPVGWALRGASVVLGGIFYPVAVLPPALQLLGALLPMTHALTVLRGAMLEGLGIVELAGPLTALAIVSVAFLAGGLVTFAAAIHTARVDGSLAQY